MWLIGCLRWSAGDVCTGKKDATYILAQDVHTHTLATHQIPASAYKSVGGKTNCCWDPEMCNSFDFCNCCACHNSQRSSLCLLYSSVNNTSHAGTAETLFPNSLPKHLLTYKHINASMCTRVEAFAWAGEHECTRGICNLNWYVSLMHVHRCKYSHLRTRFNPHMSGMKDTKLPYIHQTTLRQVAAVKNPHGINNE